MSIQEFTEPVFPNGPSEVTDVEAIKELERLRDYRQTRNYNFPRFVKALNSAGYTVTVSTYKNAEQNPLDGIEHVRNGMLHYAYKVLNATRVAGSVQDPDTAYAMEILRYYRVQAGYDFADMSEKLYLRNISFSAAEYRTCEQGITRHVPFNVLCESARILDIPKGALFRDN